MKRIYLIIALIFPVLVSNAQMEQGKVLFSGGFNFMTGTPKTEVKQNNIVMSADGVTSSMFGLNLFGGFLVADNFAIGLGLGLNTESEKWSDADYTETESSMMVHLIPTFRYYAPINERFAFYGQFIAGIGFGSIKYEEKTGPVTLSASGGQSSMEIGLQPGFSLLMSEKFALEMRWGFLGLMSRSFKLEDGADYEQVKDPRIGLSMDLSTLRFGVTIII